MKALLVLLVATLSSAHAFASELDNEKSVTNQQVALSYDLPKTLVLRVQEGTGRTEAVESKVALSMTEATKAQMDLMNFVEVDPKNPATELDRDSSQSSYYLCFNRYNWYYPQYYYYGYSYNYSSYWSYYWGGYTYYFYRWSYWR